MEYFWIKTDMSLSRGITIKALSTEELSEKKPVIRHIKLSEEFSASILADYITTRTIKDRYHLISDELKNLCCMYNKNQKWMPIVMIDQYKKCHVYWFWSTEVIGCMSDKTEYNIDRTVKTLAINTELLKHENNFAVETEIEKMIIVRLDLAESILRRGYIGFTMNKVLT
jgi:hypothetical protein